MQPENQYNNDRLWVLMAKKKAGEADVEELAELENLLLQTNTSYSNEVIEKLWSTPLQSLPDMNIAETSWKHIQNEINGNPGKIIGIKTVLKKWMAAAAILVMAGTAAYIYRQTNNARNKALLADKVNTITTQPASKTQLSLPDGTKVWLNANSRLIYTTENFGRNNREVILNGEAFFDVVKNEKVPFIIHAGVVNITVKGTAFNVKAYPEQKNIETTLIRGLIEITTKQDPERKILVRPNEKIIVPASITTDAEKIADSTGISLYSIRRFKKAEDDIIPETVWINNKLEFDNELFKELAPKMESWFSVTIHLNDATASNKRFSGIIEKETLVQTLEALKLSYPFKYRIDGTEVWIEKK